MTPTSSPESVVIRDLNDRLRATLTGGRVMVTQGVRAKGEALEAQCIRTMQAFDTFTPDNDPHGEHDFGSMQIEGETVFWKIDYYDLNLDMGSEDPANPEVTTRVLTILLSTEW